MSAQSREFYRAEYARYGARTATWQRSRALVEVIRSNPQPITAGEAEAIFGPMLWAFSNIELILTPNTLTGEGQDIIDAAHTVKDSDSRPLGATTRVKISRDQLLTASSIVPAIRAVSQAFDEARGGGAVAG